jgi:hypothetical protein
MPASGIAHPADAGLGEILRQGSNATILGLDVQFDNAQILAGMEPPSPINQFIGSQPIFSQRAAHFRAVLPSNTAEQPSPSNRRGHQSAPARKSIT